MYIAGRLRTASRSPSTLMAVASYRCPGLLPVTVSFSPMFCASPAWVQGEGLSRGSLRTLAADGKCRQSPYPVAPDQVGGSKGCRSIPPRTAGRGGDCFLPGPQRPACSALHGCRALALTPTWSGQASPFGRLLAWPTCRSGGTRYFPDAMNSTGLPAHSQGISASPVCKYHPLFQWVRRSLRGPLVGARQSRMNGGFSLSLLDKSCLEAYSYTPLRITKSLHGEASISARFTPRRGFRF